LAYFLAAMFLFYEMGVQVSPSMMTSVLMRDMHVDAAVLGLGLGFYFYSYALMQIPAGLLFDRMPTRRLLTIAIFICVLGVVFFAYTTHIWLAALGRFFTGFGSAFAFIGVLVVATKWFEARYFAFLVGLAQLLAAIGAISGEVPLAYLLNHFDWRQASLILAAIGAVLCLLIVVFLRDPPRMKVRPSDRFESASLWPSLRQVLVNPQSGWLALYAFAAWAPMTAFAELWGVPYLMAVYHLDHAAAATAVAMVWLGVGLTSPVLGWLSDRLGRRCILLNTCAVLGLLASGLVIYVPGIPLLWAHVLLFVFGMGVAGQILSFAVVKDINQSQVSGTAIGVNNMAVVIGGAVFQPLVGWLMHQHFHSVVISDVPQYTVADYRYGLSVVPVCFALGLLASAFFIRETYCKPVQEAKAADVV
jgi:MFS family permease